MLSFLFRRPIAVLMSFLALLIFSLIAAFQLPVSLLPDIDVPQILIKVNYPNASPVEIEQNILRPLRENLLTLSGLKNIESKAGSEAGLVELFFEYGTSMNLAYIETNEKIDRLSSLLPKDLERPQVIRINTSDIPVIRLQIVPRDGQNMVEVSELTEKVLKKRLEAIEGVSLVDMNGLVKRIISISPDYTQMQSLQILEKDLLQTIEANNQDLGALSVKDGQYRYYIKLASKMKGSEDLKKLYINTAEGKSIPLFQIASIQDSIERPQGFHLLNQKQALVITIHKQAQAKMTVLMLLIYSSVNDFKKEYTDIDFLLTQDQSELLEASISNLQIDLFWGGLFAFLILFVFFGNIYIPLLIGLILPASLVLGFLVLYVFQVSINIISLSGLALGLGMTIDNAIIIFDHISRQRIAGLPVFESCVKGTSEMIAPLFSSALTTQAVFIPLVFLNGLSGALSYDQAVAVAAILTASLLVSFILLPLLYFLVFGRSNVIPREDNRLYLAMLKLYKKVYFFIFKYKKWSFSIALFLSFSTLIFYFLLPVEALPYIEKKESLYLIDWNESIDATENKRRIEHLLQIFKKTYQLSESDIGLRQFLLQQKANTIQKTELYILFSSAKQKDKISAEIKSFLKTHYPLATINLRDAPNTFEILFISNNPHFEIRFKNYAANQPLQVKELEQMLANIQGSYKNISLERGEGSMLETQVQLMVDKRNLNTYQVSYEGLLSKLKSVLGHYKLTELKNFGESIPIQISGVKSDFQNLLYQNTIANEQGQHYPLNSFIRYHFVNDYKNLTADKSGIYHSLETNKINSNIPKFSEEIKQIALKNKLNVSFEGQYFENRENLIQMLGILAISVLLLYFILAAEFESVIQPLIVLLTLPLGFAGSFIFLLLGGASVNMMSLIGMVVMLGIIDNEAILKIDTINRLKKEMDLETAVAKAGEICFKPVLMTSLTNILALLPILFTSGIGADLQKPFVLAIIGGLSIGTFTAMYFVPLAYRFLPNKGSSKDQSIKYWG